MVIEKRSFDTLYVEARCRKNGPTIAVSAAINMVKEKGGTDRSRPWHAARLNCYAACGVSETTLFSTFLLGFPQYPAHASISFRRFSNKSPRW